MTSLSLTQQAAAKSMGIKQPKGSDMIRGDFANLSERKLMHCLTRLGSAWTSTATVCSTRQPMGS